VIQNVRSGGRTGKAKRFQDRKFAPSEFDLAHLLEKSTSHTQVRLAARLYSAGALRSFTGP
jgi:hypothetical protein